MPLLRIGGLVGTLAVLASVFFVIRPAMKDSNDAVREAIKQSNESVDRAVDAARDQGAATQASKSTDTAGESADAGSTTDADPSAANQIEPETLSRTVDAIKAEIGDDAKLLTFVVNPEYGGSVQYQESSDSAAGFRWAAAQDNALEPVEVKLSGDGKLSDNVFPISKLDPSVPAKILAAIKQKESGFEISAATLGLNPVDGSLMWSMPGETETRTGIVFTASWDGSGLEKIG